MAEEASDSGGIVFLPTPLGIRFPYFRSRMRCAVFGLGLENTRGQIARAMYEGIAFRIREILQGIEKDLKVQVRQMKVDGGVSRSAILVRLISAACGIPVLRSSEPELSSTGAALLAGIGTGWWRSEDDLGSMPGEYEIFASPREEKSMDRKYIRWKRAVNLAHNSAVKWNFTEQWKSIYYARYDKVDSVSSALPGIFYCYDSRFSCYRTFQAVTAVQSGTQICLRYGWIYLLVLPVHCGS